MLEFDIKNIKTLLLSAEDQGLVLIEEKGNKLKVLHDEKMYDILVKFSDPDHKSFIINVEGYDFPVKVNEPIDQLIQKLGFLKPVAYLVKELKAPMPGLVLDLYVQVGEEVNEGQNLMSLEAMKMENILKSPGKGIIKEITVQKGAAVDKNQTLIVFE
ncbi:MAG: biotin/lipoyl-containing protein [Saprospiraceae bacterium]